MAEKPILGYWNFQGMAYGIRNLLRHLGVEFEEKNYIFGDETPGERWQDVKPTLDMYFPNLPYWKDGDLYHSETLAIFRSICRKYRPEYLGRTLAEQSRADAFGASLAEKFANWKYNHVFPYDFEDKVEEGIAQAMDILNNVVACIGEGPCLAGELTYVDFGLMFELSVMKLYAPFLIDDNATLTAYMERMMSLENVADSIKEQNQLFCPLPPIAGLQKKLSDTEYN